MYAAFFDININVKIHCNIIVAVDFIITLFIYPKYVRESPVQRRLRHS